MVLGLGWPLILQLLTLGSFTGFLAGLLGIGGGMLMVPFMTLILSQHGVPAGLLIGLVPRPGKPTPARSIIIVLDIRELLSRFPPWKSMTV